MVLPTNFNSCMRDYTLVTIAAVDEITTHTLDVMLGEFD